MEDNEIVDINVETEKEEKYMLEIKKRIKYAELKDILKKKLLNILISKFYIKINYIKVKIIPKLLIWNKERKFIYF